MRLGYLLFLVNILINVVAYPILPEQVITHWNAAGVPDGYSSKLVSTALMILVQGFIMGIYLIIPRIDPQKRVNTSKPYFTQLMNLVLGYFMLINLAMIAQNLGYQFNLTAVILPSVGVLLYFIGDIMAKAEPNWFVGVRTPWTLSSEEVWYATHERAGVLFKASGLVSVLGIFFPRYGIWLLLASVTTTGLYILFYSYIKYNELKD